MAWKIRKPIQGRHLRGKFKQLTAAYMELYRRYMEVKGPSGELVRPATMDEVAASSTGQAIIVRS